MTVRLPGYFLQKGRGLDFLDGTNTTWTLNSATNEISLTIAISTSAIADGAVTYAKIQNGSALSVLGRASNSSGVLADISAGADGQVLLRNASALAWTAPSAPAAGLTISANLAFAFANDLGALEGLGGAGLAVRTTTDTWANRTLQAPAAGITITNPTGAAGDPTLVLANDLGALEALASTGLAARTGADTWAQRTLQPPAAGVTISNPAGVAGDPTLALANDLSALEGLSSTGIAVRTGSDAWAQRTLQAPAAGITITNPAGVAGDPTLVLANDLSAVEGISGNGMAVRTATDTWTVRTHTGSASITVTNGDGVAGAPTYSINTSWVGQTAITTLGTITTGTWTGTAIAAVNGGTGQTVYTVGDILYASTTTALSKLAVGTSTQVLHGGTIPAYSAIVAGDLPALGGNPTVKVGTAVVNGTATTYLRSDGAPQIDQAIIPTWTQLHTFTATIGAKITSAQPRMSFFENDQVADHGGIECLVSGGSYFIRTMADSDVAGENAYVITRGTTTTVTSHTFRTNNTDRVIIDSTGISTGTWNATAIAATKGGTGITAYTLGDTLYSSAANTLLALAGNITTTKKFYNQTGNGSVSAAPVWSALAAADIPFAAPGAIGGTTPGSGAFTTVTASTSILCTGTTGVGYNTGAGGAVTQGTSRTTGVTVNAPVGAITMFSAAGSATAATFTVTNSAVAATDVIHLSQKNGTNLYNLLVTAVAASSFNITFFTTGGTATDAPVINFAVIKGVTS